MQKGQVAGERKNRLLKALWGGHTAALQFMLGRQLQVGERKHAIQSRRLQDETSSIRIYLKHKDVVSLLAARCRGIQHGILSS